MDQPVNGTSERLLTLLDLAKAAPSGAGLGADFDDAFNEPQVAADIEARMASIAADIQTQMTSIAADLNAQEPSVAADIETQMASIAADINQQVPSVGADGPI